MAHGFMQRFKGRIAVPFGGIWQGGVQSAGQFINAGAPTSGTSGTAAGIAPPGSSLVDTTNGLQYINSGTQASPTWTASVGSAAGSVNTGLTATGSTFAGALALTAQDNVMATVAPGTGVVLGTLAAGQQQRIWHRTATSVLKIYAPAGATIDGTAGTTGVSLTTAKAALFFAENASTVVSAVLGTTSA